MKVLKISLGDEFRQLRGQTLTNNNKSLSNSGTKSATKKMPKKEKLTWKEKFDDINKYEDRITCADFLELFKFKRIEAGKAYYPSKGRDLKAFKTSIERYGIVCTYNAVMFIFDSGQDYIDIFISSPTLFISAYMDTLLRDSELWIDGKYQNKKKKGKVTREWTGDKKDTGVASIGVWDD